MATPSSGTTASCLSAQVCRIICNTATESDYSGDVLNDQGLLQWNIIKKLLPPTVRPEAENAEYFVSCVSALSPVLTAVHRHYTKTDPDILISVLQPYLSWTSEPRMLLRCVQLTMVDDTVGPIHSVLMCTTILERSLGDLYLLKGKQCPSMLKDLLMTKELQQLLGDTPLHLLRVLIGPPISLNLRNVLWHGFPSRKEIHPWFSYILLCVMGSIGQILEVKKISDNSIPHRVWVNFPQSTHIEHLLLQDVGFTGNDLRDLENLFKQCEFVQSCMIDIWLRGLTMYREERYGDCVCLLLPQLEHGLRRCFAAANNCPHRVLTAESTVLFTTMDEILSAQMEDGTENRLRYHIGDHLTTLLLDILSYPAGPRLRDRVSHGETNLSDTPASVATVLLAVCGICALNEQEAKRKHPNNADLRPIDETICDKNSDLCLLFKRLLASLSTYRSLYHPMAIVQSQILKCAVTLGKWKTMPKPDLADIGSSVRWPSEGASGSVSSVSVGQIWLYGFFKKSSIPGSLDSCVLEPFYELEACYKQYLDHALHTLYRSTTDTQKTKEQEIVNLLLQTTLQSHLVAKQVINVVEERYQHYVKKELRSRQRKTYARMLDSIPILSGGLRLVLMWCSGILYAVDHIKTIDVKEQLHIIKLLKNILQYVELLTTYTSSDKNRWEEASTITTQIINKMRHAQDILI